MAKQGINMARLTRLLLVLSLAIASTGCTLCQSPEDDTYAAYGGRWPRYDRQQGRVGSPLSETGVVMSEMDAMSDMQLIGPKSAADISAERGLYRGIDDDPPPPPPASP
jgi:hypothetical protein